MVLPRDFGEKLHLPASSLVLVFKKQGKHPPIRTVVSLLKAVVNRGNSHEATAMGLRAVVMEEDNNAIGEGA